MLNDTQRIKSFLPWVVFFVTISSACLLFLLGIHFAKYLIFAFSILSIVLIFDKETFKESIKQISIFLTPWLFWLLSLLVLSAIHGADGYSYGYNALLIMVLVFLSLQPISLSRNLLIRVIALFLFFMSIAIIIHVLTIGFIDNGVYSVNKNKVAGVVTFLSICCFSSLIFEKDIFAFKEQIFIALSVLTSLLCIVLLEARTALLAYFALVLVVCLGKKFKVALVVLIISCIMVALFSATGRIQQGISDLQNFQDGNNRTSWGIRLELWKFALIGFCDSPVYGWGSKAFDALVDNGYVFGVQDYFRTHFHSDFFQTLVGGGLIGVIGWISTLILLVRQSWKDFTKLALLASILAMGLTDRYWSHWITFYPFVSLWVLLYLSWDSEENRIKNV